LRTGTLAARHKDPRGGPIVLNEPQVYEPEGILKPRACHARALESNLGRISIVVDATGMLVSSGLHPSTSPVRLCGFIPPRQLWKDSMMARYGDRDIANANPPERELAEL
jgi:hypothetical protein